MATLLGTYNGALRILKESRLASTSDDVTARYLLDDAIDGVIAHALELGQWNFASRSATIAGSVSANRGYAYRVAKPADLVRPITISASSSYYPPLEDYDEDATYWYTNATSLYVTYVSDNASYGGDKTKWPETFSRVIEASLALEIAPSLSKSDELTKRAEGIFDDALRQSRAKDAINRTVRVVSATTRDIYNEALRLVGRRLLGNFSDDIIARRIYDPGQQPANGQQGRPPSNGSNEIEMEATRRRLLDECWDASVEYMLAQGLWNFGQRTVALEYVTDVEPAFGYSYIFERPDDYVRTVAISSSGELFPPLAAGEYLEENGYLLANCNPLYLQYISNHTSYGLDQSRWPETFKKALAAYLAVEIAPTARMSAAAIDALETKLYGRIKDARTKDAVDQGPMRLPPGRLVMSRSGGRLSNDQRRA